MDILPLQSVDLMYEIACGLRAFRFVNYDKSLRFSFYERLTKRLNYIIKELEAAEKYVGMEYMESVSYSIKLKEYFKIMKIFELSDENVTLINTLDDLEAKDNTYDQ